MPKLNGNNNSKKKSEKNESVYRRSHSVSAISIMEEYSVKDRKETKDQKVINTKKESHEIISLY